MAEAKAMNDLMDLAAAAAGAPPIVAPPVALLGTALGGRRYTGSGGFVSATYLPPPHPQPMMNRLLSTPLPLENQRFMANPDAVECQRVVLRVGVKNEMKTTLLMLLTYLQSFCRVMAPGTVSYLSPFAESGSGMSRGLVHRCRTRQSNFA
jgi:hypothetical protein